jgi:alpha-tubulin suppressor-like RCC1 family protein
MVIAARGTGEAPQTNWNQPASYTDPTTYYGVGYDNEQFYNRLFYDNRHAGGSLKFGLQPVIYQTPAVLDWINVFNLGPAFTDVASGAAAVVNSVHQAESQCGGSVDYIFTGYSLGAWVIHEAIQKLTPELNKLGNRIKGVALFGDPLFDPTIPVVQCCSLIPGQSVPVFDGVANLVDPDAVAVPKRLQKVTASYCFPTDPVCQGPALPLNLPICLAEESSGVPGDGLCSHYRYSTDGKTVDAADLLTANLPLTSPPSPHAFAWGKNIFIGTTAESLVPVEVSGLANVKQVASGNSFSLALEADGTVWAWGANGDGELGNGSDSNSFVPVQVAGLTGVTAIAASVYDGLALKSDGTVWAWGANFDGELGNGTTTESNTPVQVIGLTGVTAISASFHDLALRNDGTVWAWGANFYGELGNGTTTQATMPVRVSGLTGVSSIAAGNVHSVAIRNDGTVWAWGANFSGQLGDGTNTDHATPIRVPNLANITQISTKWHYNLALGADGIIRAWGANSFGQLGNGTTSDSNIPVQVTGLTTAKKIFAGSANSVAELADGTVWVWGDYEFSQFGKGPLTGSAVPVLGRQNIFGLVTASAGYEHDLAVVRS